MMSPHLPVTPAQIATASIEAAEAGASIIHLHAQPQTGKPDLSVETFMQFLPTIKQATDAVTMSRQAWYLHEHGRTAAGGHVNQPGNGQPEIRLHEFRHFPLPRNDNRYDREPEFLGMTRISSFPIRSQPLNTPSGSWGCNTAPLEFECRLGHLYK